FLGGMLPSRWVLIWRPSGVTRSTGGRHDVIFAVVRAQLKGRDAFEAGRRRVSPDSITARARNRRLSTICVRSTGTQRAHALLTCKSRNKQELVHESAERCRRNSGLC